MKKFLFCLVVFLMGSQFWTLRAQDMYIINSSGFQNIQNLIDGTSAPATAGQNSNYVDVGISGNYIETITLNILNNSGYDIKIHAKLADGSFETVGETDKPGIFTFPVNAIAYAFDIQANFYSAGTAQLSITEVTAVAYNYVTTYAYDDSGNRFSRSISIQTLKSTFDLEDDLIQNHEIQYLSEKNISIFPNPTQGELSVQLSEFPENVGINAQLFDLNGKKILEVKIINGRNTINIADYKAGSYILKLNSDTEQQSYKIVKY